MTTQQGRVLLTGFEPGSIEGHLAALGRTGFATEVETGPARAVERLESERFEVVVARYPLAPGEVGSLLGSLRGGGSLNVSAGLILLADPSHLRAAAGLVGRGVSKALSSSEEPAVLAIVVEQMVQMSLPMLERLPLHCPVQTVIDGVSYSWITENLSGAGMLVEADDPPSVGHTFHFVLELPSGEVEGQAKVVRQVNSGREPVAGFGARFLYLEGDGKARLLGELRDARQVVPV